MVLSIRVKDKPAWESLPDVLQLVKQTETELGAQGRIFLRYSGTEPKARLLIEGPDKTQIETRARAIIDRIRQHIGA